MDLKIVFRMTKCRLSQYLKEIRDKKLKKSNFRSKVYPQKIVRSFHLFRFPCFYSPPLINISTPKLKLCTKPNVIRRKMVSDLFRHHAGPYLMFAQNFPLLYCCTAELFPAVQQCSSGNYFHLNDIFFASVSFCHAL